MSEDELSIAGRRRALVERIQTEGAEAAYEAALAIVNDPKAPAPARATSLTAILRAGGYFSNRDDGPSDKPASEMSYDELQQSVEGLRRESRRRGNSAKSIFD